MAQVEGASTTLSDAALSENVASPQPDENQQPDIPQSAENETGPASIPLTPDVIAPCLSVLSRTGNGLGRLSYLQT